jgi:hypothetical protein
MKEEKVRRTSMYIYSIWLRNQRARRREHKYMHTPVAIAHLPGELPVGRRILHEERVEAAEPVPVRGHVVPAVRLVDVHLALLLRPPPAAHVNRYSIVLLLLAQCWLRKIKREYQRKEKNNIFKPLKN